MCEKIQKFEIVVEVDFQNYDASDSLERFGEEPKNWYYLDNQDILHDKVYYTIDDLIEYKEWVKNNMYASIPRDIKELIKYMYHEDWNEEQPHWINFNQIKIIEINGYLEEEFYEFY